MKEIGTGLWSNIKNNLNENFESIGDLNQFINIYSALQRIPSFFYGLNGFTKYKRFNFGSFTDIHNYFSRLQGFQRFVNLINDEIKCNVMQGDIIGESATKDGALTKCQNYATLTTGFNVDTLSCIGNHDINAYYGNTTDLVLTKQEQRNNLLNLSMANTEVNYPSSSVCYYYKDYVDDDYKIRIIVLDQYETPEYSTDGTYDYTMYQSKHYSNTQLNWLCNTALNLPSSDYHVILVNHEGLSSVGTYNDCHIVLRKIIDAFATQGIVNEIDNTTDFEYNVQADFSLINGFNGNFIMCLYGHVHEPNVGTITINGNTYNNIRTIATGNTYGYNRVENTPTEETASVISIDTLTKNIYILRYGAKCDCNGIGLPHGDYGIETEITY